MSSWQTLGWRRKMSVMLHRGPILSVVLLSIFRLKCWIGKDMVHLLTGGILEWLLMKCSQDCHLGILLIERNFLIVSAMLHWNSLTMCLELLPLPFRYVFGTLYTNLVLCIIVNMYYCRGYWTEIPASAWELEVVLRWWTMLFSMGFIISTQNCSSIQPLQGSRKCGRFWELWRWIHLYATSISRWHQCGRIGSIE